MSEYIFKLPDLGEGTVESEIGEWKRQGRRETVAEDAIVGTMMTDKAAVELNSPVTGIVKSLAGEPGDMIAVGAPLIVFETDADAVVETPATNEEPVAAAATEVPVEIAATPARNGKVMTSPAIRRRAREAGIDLSTSSGQRRRRGRILREDFEQFIASLGDQPAPASAVRATTRTEELKVIGLRRVIAERMAEANREVPHFSYVEEIDITELESLRQHLNSSKPDKADHLTLPPFPRPRPRACTERLSAMQHHLRQGTQRAAQARSSSFRGRDANA